MNNVSIVFYLFKTVFLGDVWVFLVIHFTHEHIVRTSPELMLAVESAIDDELFFGFAIVGNVFYDVHFALKVAVEVVEF